MCTSKPVHTAKVVISDPNVAKCYGYLYQVVCGCCLVCSDGQMHSIIRSFGVDFTLSSLLVAVPIDQIVLEEMVHTLISLSTRYGNAWTFILLMRRRLALSSNYCFGLRGRYAFCPGESCKDVLCDVWHICGLVGFCMSYALHDDSSANVPADGPVVWHTYVRVVCHLWRSISYL